MYLSINFSANVPSLYLSTTYAWQSLNKFLFTNAATPPKCLLAFTFVYLLLQKRYNNKQRTYALKHHYFHKFKCVSHKEMISGSSQSNRVNFSSLKFCERPLTFHWTAVISEITVCSKLPWRRPPLPRLRKFPWPFPRPLASPEPPVIFEDRQNLKVKHFESKFRWTIA